MSAGKIIKSRLLVRTIIETTNLLVIEETGKNILKFRIHSVEAARKTDADMVAAPQKDWEDFKDLKRFLFQRVYQSPQVCIMNEKGRLILKRIFEHLERKPEMLPRNFRSRLENASGPGGKEKGDRRLPFRDDRPVCHGSLPDDVRAL